MAVRARSIRAFMVISIDALLTDAILNDTAIGRSCISAGGKRRKHDMSIHFRLILAVLGMALTAAMSFSATPPSKGATPLAKDKTAQQEKPARAKKTADRAAEAA